MEWSEEEVETMWKTRPDFAPPPSVIRAIASKAVDLVAARGGTMTIEQANTACDLLTDRWPNVARALRVHISAQGARVAVFEAEKERLLADWREYKAAKDVDGVKDRSAMVTNAVAMAAGKAVVSEAYEHGAEAMRAACLDAFNTICDKYGINEASPMREEGRLAIEGAVP